MSNELNYTSFDYSNTKGALAVAETAGVAVVYKDKAQEANALLDAENVGHILNTEPELVIDVIAYRFTEHKGMQSEEQVEIGQEPKVIIRDRLYLWDKTGKVYESKAYSFIGDCKKLLNVFKPSVANPFKLKVVADRSSGSLKYKVRAL